jgi:type 1 fimbria pilin
MSNGPTNSIPRAFRLPNSWLALLACALLAATSFARAGCSFDRGDSTGTYSVSVPATMVNDPGIPIGASLYTSSLTAINQSVSFSCNGSQNYWGLINRAGATPGAGQYLFPIGTTGISFRITQTSGSYPGLIGSWPFQSLSSNTTWTEADPVTVELVKTGNISDGTVVSGALADFRAGTSGNNIVDAAIVLARSLTFVAPACSVPSSLTVPLPTVTTSALAGGTGATTGDKPFAIPLTCSANARVAITLDSTNPINRPNGVLSNSGTATGVGVQVAWNGSPGISGNPVTLGTAVTFNAANGVSQIPLVVRYYRTTGALASGSVTATATYTLTYP